MNTSRKTVIGGVVGVIVAIGLVIAGAYAFGGLGINGATSSINSMTTQQSISTANGGSSTSGGSGSTGVSTSTTTSSSGGAGSGSTGMLQISMIDPPNVPANVVDVYINYSAIQVQISNSSTNSGWTNITQSGTLNLTSIITSSDVIGQATLPTGTYNIIRFNVTGAVVTVNDSGTLTNYTASVPASMVQSTITGGVSVQPNALSSVQVDISPTVTGANGSYTLIPSATAQPQAPINGGAAVTTNVTQSNHTVSVSTGARTNTTST